MVKTRAEVKSSTLQLKSTQVKRYMGLGEDIQ